MSNVWIVLKREFLERVRTKSFLIGTVLFPLFMALMMMGPALMAGGNDVKLAVVNEASAPIGDGFRAVLTAASEDDEANKYELEMVSGGIAANRDELNRRVREKELYGYVVLPADIVASSSLQLRARNISNFTMERDIRRAASQAVQAQRLQSAGLRGADVAALMKPVGVQAARITKTGEEAGDAESTFFLGYIAGFLVYMLTLLYGINVLRSVLEEKTNRIVEIIISSMKAEHLMLGKVLGVASVALLQVGIWIGAGALLVSQSAFIASKFGMPADALTLPAGSAGMLFGVVGFFIMGFLLYAALFAALGAAVNSEQEAQQFQTVLMAPLIGALLSIVAVISDPLGRMATIMGTIPFTSPVVMPMRMATVAVPPTQIAISLALLTVSVLLVTWLAGKIYRVGILSTGKKPTIREMVRWVRAA